MLGICRGGTTPLARALGRAGNLCDAGSIRCFFIALVVAGTAFSSITVAASPETTGKRSVGATAPHSKAIVNKQDVSCEVPEASASLSASQQNLRKRSCLLSLSAVDKLRTQKDFSFVDVRSPSSYDRYRIAGSINIPLHQIKTKEFLKKLPIVLVNDGRSTTELEIACGDLRQVGFERVAVLNGGLLAWYSNRRVLEGDPTEQAKLTRMSADELFVERAKPNWFVIDASTQKKDKKLIAWLPPKVITVPYKAKSKADSIARISAAILQQRKKNPQSKLLLIADADDIYERIDARLNKSGVTSGVLRLEGGLKGYREHVENQLALWEQQKEQNQPRRYTACPG